MAANRNRPFLRVFTEDEPYRQMLNGFELALDRNARQLERPPVSGGWLKCRTHVAATLRNTFALVVVLVDFDEHLNRVEQIFPDGLPDRTYVFGSFKEAENLRRELGLTYEQLGERVADECRDARQESIWEHPLLRHNRAMLDRAMNELRPLFFS